MEKNLEKWIKKQTGGEEYKYQGCKGVWNFYELKEWEMDKDMAVLDGEKEGRDEQETKDDEEAWDVVNGKGEEGQTAMSGDEKKQN
jgi:hypothetical protein